MRFLYVDVETTGLDFSKDRIIELGFGVSDSEIYSYVLKQSDVLVPSEIVEITGITQEEVNHGWSPSVAMSKFIDAARHVDFVVAHNANGFDRPMIEAELRRLGLDTPELKWIDTMTDLGIPPKYKCKRLSHLCLDHGIKVDPDKLHRTTGDIHYLIQLCKVYDMKKASELSQEPCYVLRAFVDFNNNQKARDRQYRWQVLGGKLYPKSWVKRVRKSELQSEIASSDFRVQILEEE